LSKTITTVSLIASSSLLISQARAQIEVIEVTATRRPEVAQDVPIALHALTTETLDQLDINSFTDYLVHLPGVTAGGSGPGQSTIYIRGVASTTPTISVATVAGLTPNVALYLDEQPVTQPGRNLDVYAVDLERVEVLSGPQGTLFGASSQAGNVRLITAKPDPEGFFSRITFGASAMPNGEPGGKAEAVLNAPVSDDFALRAVVFSDRQGGFINNVPASIDVSRSRRFEPASLVRSNGVPLGPESEGFQSGADLSAVNFVQRNNDEFVEEDFNPVTYQGFRISGLYEIGFDWRVTLSHMQQRIEADGVFMIDPNLDDTDELSVQRFADEFADDAFDNTSLLVEGRIGELEALLSVAWLDREVDSVLDYTEYLFVGQYLPYYICDASVTYPAEAPAGNCFDARTFLAGNTKSNVFSRELRFNTPTDNRWRSTFGVFFSDTEILELNDFTYPGSINVESFTPGVFGFPPNYPLPGAWRQDPGPFPEEVIFRNDIRRTDEQYGAFAELSWDLAPDTLTITGGIRNYEIDVDLQGSANSSFGNLGQAEDQQRFGANLSALYNGSNSAEVGGRTISLPDAANADGNIYKLNLAWTPRDGSLFYATYSEGFRPPLLNRPVGAGGVVPAVVRTDELVNWEIGGKTLTADRNLQLNWSAFIENIDDLQSTIFDSNIVNLFFSDNAANARVRGVEADFIWLPEAIDGLTVSGAISLLDTEILETISTTSAIAPAGSELANAPGLQTSLRARYEWNLGNGMDVWIMPQLSHSSSSYSDIVLINRIEQDAWTVLDVSAGVIRGNWRVDARIGNLTDERAVLTSWYGNDRERLTINRPRSLGIQVTYEM